MKPYERRYIYIYINIEVIINNKVYILSSKQGTRYYLYKSYEDMLRR